MLVGRLRAVTFLDLVFVENLFRGEFSSHRFIFVENEKPNQNYCEVCFGSDFLLILSVRFAFSSAWFKV